MDQVEVLGKAVNGSVSVEELTGNLADQDNDQEDDDFVDVHNDENESKRFFSNRYPLTAGKKDQWRRS